MISPQKWWWARFYFGFVSSEKTISLAFLLWNVLGAFNVLLYKERRAKKIKSQRPYVLQGHGNCDKLSSFRKETGSFAASLVTLSSRKKDWARHKWFHFKNRICLLEFLIANVVVSCFVIRKLFKGNFLIEIFTEPDSSSTACRLLARQPRCHLTKFLHLVYWTLLVLFRVSERDDQLLAFKKLLFLSCEHSRNENIDNQSRRVADDRKVPKHIWCSHEDVFDDVTKKIEATPGEFSILHAWLHHAGFCLLTLIDPMLIEMKYFRGHTSLAEIISLREDEMLNATTRLIKLR